jgi:hypothetical protein
MSRLLEFFPTREEAERSDDQRDQHPHERLGKSILARKVFVFDASNEAVRVERFVLTCLGG